MASLVLPSDGYGRYDRINETLVGIRKLMTTTCADKTVALTPDWGLLAGFKTAAGG